MIKVAIVHDWLVSYGGAEEFLSLLLKIYPTADIYTLVYDKKRLGDHFLNNKITPSPLQKFPFAKKFYQKLLKWFPRAIESFDLRSYDLVISSSSCCAMGVITRPATPHIAFIHSPMRYAWDMFFDYRERSGAITRFFMDRWMSSVRQWDYLAAQRPDVLVANSHYIARRIKKFWGRDASVIYLPVNLERALFTTKAPPLSLSHPISDVPYYATFSRLVQYKRIDLAIKACLKLNRPLFVIGSGGEFKTLKKIAGSSPLIHFTGRASDECVAEILRNASALLFPAEEDYGLTPLEAQALGCPVIAYGRGGALETVTDGVSGLFFSAQTVDSLIEAIKTFEDRAWDKKLISKKVRDNDFQKFKKEWDAAVQDAVSIATGANL